MPACGGPPRREPDARAAAQVDRAQAGTGDNHAISALKFKIIREFLELGWNVLLSDVDIVVVQARAAAAHALHGAGLGYTGVRVGSCMPSLALHVCTALQARQARLGAVCPRLAVCAGSRPLAAPSLAAPCRLLCVCATGHLRSARTLCVCGLLVLLVMPAAGPVNPRLSLGALCHSSESCVRRAEPVSPPVP